MKKTVTSFFALLVILLGYSIVKADTVSMPTGLTASPLSASSIGLNWVTSSDAVGYEIYRGTESNLIATTTFTDRYTDSGLSANTLYSYFIDAINASGTRSSVTAGVSTTTLADVLAPSVPENLSAQVVSNFQIDLSWTASTDDVSVKEYRIYKKNALFAVTSGLSFSDIGLTASNTYAYQVSAVDFSGNESARSATATATIILDNEAPSVPSIISVIPVSSSQINLSWTASADYFSLKGYRLYQDNVFYDATSSRSYSFTGLAASSTHTYQVSAIDASGNESARSETATGTTLAATPNTPPAPQASGNVEIKILTGLEKGRMVNRRSNGIINLAVFGSASLDVKTIQKNTVFLGGAKAVVSRLRDINKDGKMDMVYAFRSREMKDLYDGDTRAKFSATASGNVQLTAQADVRVKNNPRPKKAAVKQTIKKTVAKTVEKKEVKKEVSKPVVEKTEEKAKTVSRQNKGQAKKTVTVNEKKEEKTKGNSKK